MLNTKIVTLVGLLPLIPVAMCRAADAPPPPAIIGSFRFLPERSDSIDSAIEKAIAPMTFIARPFARRRLRKINVPYARLTIGSTGDAIVVVADPRVPVRTPLDGKPVNWHREDGEPFTVRGGWDGAAFQQTFASGTGRRINRYTVSADGQTLTMRVSVWGGGLPGTMTYELVYRRET